MLPRGLHAAVALVVLACLVVQLVLLLVSGTDANTGESQAAVPLGTRFVRLVSYFTIQSNLLVLATSASLALAPQRDGRLWRVLRLDALLGIAVTGIVYGLVLASTVHLEGAARWTGIGLHVVAPGGTLAVWLLFGPRPRIGWSTAAWAFVWPLAWLGYTLAHGALSGWYPYAFLDVGVLGYPKALLATAVVLVLALVLVLVLKGLDRLPAPGSRSAR